MTIKLITDISGLRPIKERYKFNKTMMIYIIYDMLNDFDLPIYLEIEKLVDFDNPIIQSFYYSFLVLRDKIELEFKLNFSLVLSKLYFNISDLYTRIVNEYGLSGLSIENIDINDKACTITIRFHN